MPSTFFGLTISGSGLSTYQTAINTTANNISNIKTPGYSRQIAIQKAAEALKTNTSYGMAGSGVVTTSIQQVRDMYYDLKYWQNNTKLGEFETKYEYMQQIETAFQDDDTIKGFSSIYTSMYNALHDLANNPSDESYRNQFINFSASFADYFNQTTQTLSNMQKDCNTVMYTQVQRINEIGQEVSLLNQQINVIEIQGNEASQLRDQRALLIDELSKLVPVDVKETPVVNSNDENMKTGANVYTVKINGHVLVSGNKYDTLTTQARTEKVNQTDADGLYDVYWSSGESLNLASSAMSGELKALYDVRDGNNQENFKGTISNVATISNPTGPGYLSEVTISNPSMSSVNELTIAEQGKIKLGNKYYEYSDFKLNNDGTYTFTLKSQVDNPSQYQGKKATIGESVDFMGIPYYMSQMTQFVRSFTEKFNAIHTTGQDAKGNQAGNFFTGVNNTTGEDYKLDATDLTSKSDSLYKITGVNFSVSNALLKTPSLMSTSTDITKGDEFKDIAEKLLDLESNQVIFRGATASKFLESVLSDISIDTNKVKTFTENYTNISGVIVNQRLAISGVDEDEEALALVQFQNAYNLSSRMVQCMSEIYNRLILETGV